MNTRLVVIQRKIPTSVIGLSLFPTLYSIAAIRRGLPPLPPLALLPLAEIAIAMIKPSADNIVFVFVIVSNLVRYDIKQYMVKYSHYSMKKCNNSENVQFLRCCSMNTREATKYEKSLGVVGK